MLAGVGPVWQTWHMAHTATKNIEYKKVRYTYYFGTCVQYSTLHTPKTHDHDPRVDNPSTYILHTPYSILHTPYSILNPLPSQKNILILINHTTRYMHKLHRLLIQPQLQKKLHCAIIIIIIIFVLTYACFNSYIYIYILIMRPVESTVRDTYGIVGMVRGGSYIA